MTYESSPSQESSKLSRVATLLHLLSPNLTFKLKEGGRIPLSLMVSSATSAAEAEVAPILTSDSGVMKVLGQVVGYTIYRGRVYRRYILHIPAQYNYIHTITYMVHAIHGSDVKAGVL